jgi:hypothetical protein
MTVEERQQIEAEMRAQHLHPLALKIEQEEMERRLSNQLQYYSQRTTTQQQRSRPSQSQLQHIPRRNLLLEHPPLLAPPSSQQQQQAQAQRFMTDLLDRTAAGPSQSHDSGLYMSSSPMSILTQLPTAVRGLSEEEQIALAIEASLRD